MLFVLSKVLGFVATPSNDLILLGLLGLLLMVTPWRRIGTRLMVSSILLLAIAGYSPIGDLLLQPLEDRFPPWDQTHGPPDGIVVLGGAISPDVSAARREPQLNEAAERITAAVDLARRYKSAKLVYSGGNGGLLFSDAMEADQARVLLLRLGVPPEQLTIERKSRNTAENAAFTRTLMQVRPGQRWLLVTSAAHMPRAIGVFRKIGFPVEAYPVDWRTGGPSDVTVPFDRLSAGLARLDTAMHEWVGLVAYWIAGKTSALFPAPAPISRGGAAPADKRP